MDIADQISRLVALKKDGFLSEEEFEAQRKAVLSRSLSISSGNPVHTRPSLPPATSAAIGTYDLFEQVGEGGMGSVFRGRHRVAAMAARQGGDVAVKLLHGHLTSQSGFVERFRAEAEALAALEHPNIVRVYDVVEEPGRIALVMEWVPGKALSEIIGRETGPMPWERAWRLAQPVFSALRHAHSRSVIHRDLKPDNIRVTPDGVVKVLDFGIARLGEGRGRTKTGTAMGTIDYMAPEQYANARSVDARADVYALGMTLYEMLAGRLPWDASEAEFAVLQRKHQGDLPPPTAFYPEIPPWVVQAVMAALQADPGKRTGSVDALESGLQQAGATRASGPVRSRPAQPRDDVDLGAYARVTAPAPQPLRAQQASGDAPKSVGQLERLGLVGFLAVTFGVLVIGAYLLVFLGALLQ